MAAGNVGPSSWTCEVEGDFTPVFDNFILYMMTLSPDEVLREGERLYTNTGDKGSKDSLDGGKLSHFTKQNSTSSSSSSSSSESEAEEAELEILQPQKSHSGRLRNFWNRDCLFRLESAHNPRNRKDVYHVVKDVYDVAEKEMRINDRLVAMNDEDTKNKSLKDVENMWEQLRKAPLIQLRVWRWILDMNGEQICEIKIVFRTSEGMYKELSSSSLGLKIPRRVTDLQWTSSKFRPYHMRIACISGIYVSANVDDMALYGKCIDKSPKQYQFRFLIRYFGCLVESDDGKFNKRFGFVAKYKENGKYFDISSIITESASTVILKPHVSFHSKSPDERFFIMYEVKDEDDVFESLLYENLFMKFNNETKKITMQERKAPGPFFLFETFKAHGDKPPQVDISCFSDGGRLFAFEPIPEDDCACQS